MTNTEINDQQPSSQVSLQKFTLLTETNNQTSNLMDIKISAINDPARGIPTIELIRVNGASQPKKFHFIRINIIVLLDKNDTV